MIITYQAENFSPENVRKRYVRFDPVAHKWRFCEVGSDTRYDIRQGTVESREVPKAVRAAAREKTGYYPSYVEWPIEAR